jgi:GNAT superfamily N-acetyltransferase
VPTVKDVPLPWPRAEVRPMFVDPARARRGVGTALLAAAERAIAAAGFAKVHLVATLSGVALYERAGNRAIAPVDVPLAGGRRPPCLCMERDLSATSSEQERSI